MNSNIKELLEILKIKKSDFAKVIGKTERAVYHYINNERKVDETTMLLICDKFNVNLEWLRTGQGEIFKSNLQSNTIKKIVENLEKMSEDDRQEILKFSIFKISDEKYSKKMRDNTA